MFQFPALASIIDGCYLFKVTGCPIRRFTDQGLFAPPRDLSQLITSFIASESQGIRHAPLLTFFQTYLTDDGEWNFENASAFSTAMYHICYVRFDIYF